MDSSASSDSIEVVVKGQDGRDVRYKIKPNAPLSGVMDEYCGRRGIEGVRFFHNGKRVTKKQTAAKLGLESGAVIEAMLEMHGGGYKVL